MSVRIHQWEVRLGSQLLFFWFLAMFLVQILYFLLVFCGWGCSFILLAQEWYFQKHITPVFKKLCLVEKSQSLDIYSLLCLLIMPFSMMTTNTTFVFRLKIICWCKFLWIWSVDTVEKFYSYQMPLLLGFLARFDEDQIDIWEKETMYFVKKCLIFF